MTMVPDGIDPKSGFCKSNSVFYSKREPIPLPQNEALDLATFISAQRHHGKVALIDGVTGHSLTYRHLWDAVDSMAWKLREKGIRKGQAVLILSPNSIYFPLIYLSVISLGAVITTANPLNTAEEISKQVADSRPALAFTTPELAPKLAGGNLQVVAITDSWFGEGTPSERRGRERVHQDDTATLLYSSGTTGASKGVISSHRNMIAAAVVVGGRLELNHTEEDTFMCTIPMFHVYGLAVVTGLLSAGFTIVVLPKFDLHEMLSAVSRYRVTFLPLVPPILIGLVNNADEIKSKYDLTCLRTVLSGGAPLSRELIEEFGKKFAEVKIQQGYGLTESGGIGASTQSMEENQRSGTAGLLSPGVEAMVVDPETGEALPPNRNGELWLRGPTIMKGYLSNQEATSSTLVPGGWLRTGDLCYIDDDGFVFVVDRLKELIKYKGYQVAPAELEALLLTHPGVADAAVIPISDKSVGQYPMAYVVRKDGSDLTENMIMEFVAKKVAPYKKIRRVGFIGSIPKTPSGKILRKNLISLATSRL